MLQMTKMNLDRPVGIGRTHVNKEIRVKRLLSSLLLIGSVSVVGCKSQKPAGPAEPPHAEMSQPQPYIPPPPVESAPAPTPMHAEREHASEARHHYLKYTVKKGDTLTKIAHKHHVSVKRIIAVNPGIEPNHIRVGQVINIP
jgi:LysM domain